MELGSPMVQHSRMDRQFSSPPSPGMARRTGYLVPMRHTPEPFARFASLGAPILLGLLVATTVGAKPQAQLQARASFANAAKQSWILDQDGDGLDNALEFGQHSALDRVDSDGDGWNDAEELARGTLATAACSQPTLSASSVGARSYMRGGKLHTAFAVYLRDSSFANVHLDIGIYANSRMAPLAPSSYVQRMSVITVPTHDAGALVTILDVVLPSAPLIANGKMSIWGTLKIGNEFVSATAINLVMRDGTPSELIQPSQMAPNAEQQLGPGLLYRPLGGTQTPIQWSSGEICFQRMQAVGSHGAVVTQEVTSATCVTGWDGYCDGASCTTSVGTTVDLVDPGALIGG